MASKHESTAVNELIDLARTGKAIGEDDGAELMYRPPAPRTIAPPPSASAPRTRAASGTNNHPAISAIPPIPAIPEAVRMAKSASIATIPPLSSAQSFDIGALSTPGLAIPSIGLKSTRMGLPPPVPAPARAGTQPPPPFGARGHAEGTPAPELLARRSPQVIMSPHSPTVESPIMRDAAVAPETLSADAFASHPGNHAAPPDTLDGVELKMGADPSVDEANWFDPSPSVPKVDQTWGETMAVEKPAAVVPVYKRSFFVPLAVGVAVTLVFAVGALAFSGESSSHGKGTKTVAAAEPTAKPAQKPAAAAAVAVTTTPTTAAAAAAPAVAVTPAAPAAAAPVAAAAAAQPAVVAPDAAAAPASSFVDVRFDSNPAGATVMLVDGGKTSFLGSTPVSASVDRSRRYDVVFTLAAHPTQLQHLDPSATTHIVAALAPATASPSVARVAQAAVAPAAATPRPVTATAPVQHAAAPAAHPAVADASDDDSGTGVLMVASKPPCEILIDGKDTGMQTPQKNIQLPAGAHKVTLLNKDANIAKVVGVRITPGSPTKLIQNFN